MHVIMVSVGSWGDAEPYLALAQQLLMTNDNQVDFFVQQEYETRVRQLMATTGSNTDNPSSRFRIHPFPFSTRDFYKVKPSSSKVNNNPKLRQVETIAEIIGELVLPCAEWMHSILTTTSDNGSIILSSGLSRHLCWLLARVFQIPMVLLHLQPLAPNGIFPLYRVSKDGCVQAIMEYSRESPSSHCENFEQTYWKIEEPLEDFLAERLQIAHAKFGLLPNNWLQLQSMLKGNDPMVHICNGYDSNHLVPPIAGTHGVGQNVHEIGPLADSFLPCNNFVPDPDLESFLKLHKKPICIGFGSMPFADMEAIMDALMELDMPAILLGAPFQFTNCPEKYQDFVFDKQSKLFRNAFVPYAHLLPHCSMMLCHGGAGVVHATLRAGIPCLIRPIMGDQFLFASLLEQKGLGVEVGHAAPEPSLQAHDIVQAVRQIVLSDVIMDRCHRLRQKILEQEASGTHPHGTVKLANLLQEITKAHHKNRNLGNCNAISKKMMR